jgi:hypothetical protein
MPKPKAGIRPMLYCEIIRTAMCKAVGEGIEGVPSKICSRIPPNSPLSHTSLHFLK